MMPCRCLWRKLHPGIECFICATVSNQFFQKKIFPLGVCPQIRFPFIKGFITDVRRCVCMSVDACLCRFTVRLQRFLQHGGSVRSGSVRRPAINCSSGITKWEEMLNNRCTLHWLKRPPDHLKATLGFLVSQQSLQPQKHLKTIKEVMLIKSPAPGGMSTRSLGLFKVVKLFWTWFILKSQTET